MKNNFVLIGLLVVLIGLTIWHLWYDYRISNASFIVVSKQEMNIRVVDYSGIVLCKYPIACGTNYGDKQISGDRKTPEGVFRVTEIVDASKWTHDFNDGNGEMEGAYGPYFIRLLTPGHTGIGIHGTCKPETIGTRDSEGCIRMYNEDLVKLREKCKIGMAVIITPSTYDAIANAGLDSLVMLKDSLQAN